jgi:hypothetical protein
MTDGYNPGDVAWLCNLEAIRLEQTCYACPEQYDAFVDGLRWTPSAGQESG